MIQPTPMPDIGALLRAHFQGPGPAPPAARPAVAASAPHALAGLLTGLGQLGTAPPPPALPPARPGVVSANAMEGVLSKALARPEGDDRPLWVPADTLAAYGIDAALSEAAIRFRLHIARNFDARGGALIASSPEMLEEAERLRDRGEPVPVIPVELGSVERSSRLRRPGRLRGDR